MAKPDWITVNPSSGEGTGSFNVICTGNTSTSARSGVITVRTIGGLTREIQVSQAGKAANSIQGSGVLCNIVIPTDAFPTGVSQITVGAVFNMAEDDRIAAGYVTLSTKDAQDGLSIKELSFNCERVSVPKGAEIIGIQLVGYAGPVPWSTLFEYFIGTLTFEPVNMAFKVAGTTKRYPAIFKQFNQHILGYDFTTPIPISGDTTLVIADSEEPPTIRLSLIDFK